MLDLAAFPIAVALTLWDAAPVYLSVALALSILLHAAAPRKWLHTLWNIRELLAIEGVAYLLLFDPRLAPVLVATTIASIALLRGREQPVHQVTFPTPLKASFARAGELFMPLIVASATAALIKLSAPHIPSISGIDLVVAATVGLVIGIRSGVAAIPAIAIAAHVGGLIPASLCIIAAAFRPALRALVPYMSYNAEQRR